MRRTTHILDVEPDMPADHTLSRMVEPDVLHRRLESARHASETITRRSLRVNANHPLAPQHARSLCEIAKVGCSCDRCQLDHVVFWREAARTYAKDSRTEGWRRKTYCISAIRYQNRPLGQNRFSTFSLDHPMFSASSAGTGKPPFTFHSLPSSRMGCSCRVSVDADLIEAGVQLENGRKKQEKSMAGQEAKTRPCASESVCVSTRHAETRVRSGRKHVDRSV